MSLFTYHCGCVTIFYYLSLCLGIIVIGLVCYFLGRINGYYDGWIESAENIKFGYRNIK